jgi:hypothetical protein
MEHLKCHWPVEFRIVREKNLAHSAAAYQFANVISPNDLSRPQFWLR